MTEQQKAQARLQQILGGSGNRGYAKGGKVKKDDHDADDFKRGGKVRMFKGGTLEHNYKYDGVPVKAPKGSEERKVATTFKKGGAVKMNCGGGMTKKAKGGSIDGCAIRGHTRCKGSS
jgi:hypothetical protein